MSIFFSSSSPDSTTSNASIFQSINPLRFWCANPARQKKYFERKIEKPPRRLDSCVRADVWLSSSQTKLMDFRYFIYYSSFVMFWIFFLLVEKWLKLKNQFEVPFDDAGGGVANGNPARCRVLTWDFREISIIENSSKLMKNS
jgi:hypothetical protein